jgi:hypothetical protein
LIQTDLDFRHEAPSSQMVHARNGFTQSQILLKR